MHQALGLIVVPIITEKLLKTFDEIRTGHKGIWFEKTLYTSQALSMQNLDFQSMLACSKKLVSWFEMTVKLF